MVVIEKHKNRLSLLLEEGGEVIMFAWLKIYLQGIQSLNSLFNLQAAWIDYYMRHNTIWEKSIVILEEKLKEL